MIGRSGERGSGISVLAARHDDDDDIYIYIYYISLSLSLYIYIYIYIVFVLKYIYIYIYIYSLSFSLSLSLSLYIYIYVVFVLVQEYLSQQTDGLDLRSFKGNTCLFRSSTSLLNRPEGDSHFRGCRHVSVYIIVDCGRTNYPEVRFLLMRFSGVRLRVGLKYFPTQLRV